MVRPQATAGQRDLDWGPELMAGGPMSIRMLGGFEVSVDGTLIPAEAWHRRRVADLVKLLALSPRHRLHREEVMEWLWPELDSHRAGANLRKTAHHARRALGLSDGIASDGEVIALGGARRIVSDVSRFREAAENALLSGDVDSCRAAAALYRGPLLPDDRFAPWCEEPRDRLHRTYLRLLEGGELWGRLVEVDPTHERAHCEIIRSHLRHGNRAAALRQFEDLRVTLRDSLGVLPGPASMELYDEALNMDGPDKPTPAERARALLAWGVVHWDRRDLPEVQRTAEQARALAIDAGLGRELADASELLGLVAYAQGRWRELFTDHLVEAMHADQPMTPFLVDAHMCMSEFALCEVDGLRHVAELAETILRSANEAHDSQGRAVGLLLRGECVLLGGDDPGRAGDDLETSSRIHEASASTTGWALAQERLAQLAALEGDIATASRRHRQALEIAEQSAARRHLVPFIFGGMLTPGAAVGSHGMVEEAETVMEELDICQPCAMGFWIGAVHARASSGEIEPAVEHLKRARQVAGMWTSGPWHAAVSEADAAVRAVAGAGPDEVASRLQDAITHYEAAARTRDVARCRTKLAAVSGA